MITNAILRSMRYHRGGVLDGCQRRRDAGGVGRGGGGG